MKIENIETFIADRFLIVRITTDNGIQGIGEGTFWSFPQASESIVHALKDALLIGADPLRIEHIWNANYRLYSFRGGALAAAIGAIDEALWDIKGKHYQAPVWDLLGGKVRDKVRAMVLLQATGGRVEDFVASAARAKRDGFTAVKMTPFPGDWTTMPYPQLIRECTAIVEAVRETIGWEMDMGVEIHRNMVPSEAIVFAEAIEKYLPYFYEDPIAPDSVLSMGEVAQKIKLPLAAGERNHTIWEFREYVETAGIHFVRPDVSLAGGITHVKKIAAIAESHHQRVIPHNFLGPIATACCVQLAACTPNWDLQEYVRENEPPRSDIVKQVTPLKDGYLQIPETPGIGMELDDAGVARTPFKQSAPNLLIREDGSVALR
jgi:galactonate dehydratase